MDKARCLNCLYFDHAGHNCAPADAGHYTGRRLGSLGGHGQPVHACLRFPQAVWKEGSDWCGEWKALATCKPASKNGKR